MRITNPQSAMNEGGAPMKPGSVTAAIRSSIEKSVTRHRAKISEVNQKIWKNPQVAWHETIAHDTICSYFESLGGDYKVVRGAYSIPTSFSVNVGTGGRLVVFNAEYDALPRMSADRQSPAHACGHNLIASASITAFICAWEALKARKAKGRLRLLGTPAEESGGGKVRLIKAGAYSGVDACLMVHPSPKFEDRPEVDVVALTSTLASQALTATFTGKSAHAGLAPWRGINALDAAVNAYVSVSTLRQQLEPSNRVCGIIKEGGRAPNIVPDHAVLQYSIRGPTRDKLTEVYEKIALCCEAGASASGCRVDIHSLGAYIDLRANHTLCRLLTKNLKDFNVVAEYQLPEMTAGAASDQGNVSYACPCIMSAFAIDSGTAINHTPGFTAAAGTSNAFLRAVSCGKGLAAVAYEVLMDEAVAKEVAAEFSAGVKEKVAALLADRGLKTTTEVLSEVVLVQSDTEIFEGLLTNKVEALPMSVGLVVAVDGFTKALESIVGEGMPESYKL
ncbi:hypothetical protein EDC01DRAFT_663916 [Geopyxis carbonaria]|nr:hypothetical protein EDC01DRAFT_663916 [Geopyxis carbonaria]